VTTPSIRSRRGPLLVLVIAFVALLAVPVVLATVGVDEERDAAGAAGTTTEVPTSVEDTTTSEPATTTTGSAPTTTEAPVVETTTTTIDMAPVYEYAAALERAKATPPTTAPPAPVVEYVEVPVAPAPEPEPVYEPEPEPVYEVPVSVDGDPFDGLSWSDRQFLECVKQRESGGDYGAVNPSSGAGGAYQFLQNTWNNTASHAGRGDLVGLPPQYASPYDQDFLAAHLLMWYGRSPWSYSC